MLPFLPHSLLLILVVKFGNITIRLLPLWKAQNLEERKQILPGCPANTTHHKRIDTVTMTNKQLLTVPKSYVTTGISQMCCQH